MKARWLALSTLALSACARSESRAPPPSHAPRAGCEFVVEETSAEPARLAVRAHCAGPRITGFSSADSASRGFLQITHSDPPLLAHADGFRYATAQRDVRFDYVVDLEGIARKERRIDSALRVGHSLIAPASTFLLQPEPLEMGVPITLAVRVPPGEDFASGLTPVPPPGTQRYSLQAHEMSVASYSIFGHFRRETIELGAAKLVVVTADARLDLAASVTRRWVTHSARSVAQFYGRFPMDNALVVLIPVANRQEVVFGKVLPQSSPAIAVSLGEHVPEATLYRDWVLVHELFHIGFPSFDGEAKWLDEGSATYFEPIIRARAGDLTELEVWTEFSRQMPRGLRALEHDGLEHPSDFGAVYWGGAIACLLTDVAARTRSNGAVGLEHGFRAVLAAGGNASQVWSLTQVSRVIDRALGAPILAEIIEKHANAGAPVELPALFARLGVVKNPSGAITLDDQAPWARLRHQITFGRD